jgi:hypothetical protein
MEVGRTGSSRMNERLFERVYNKTHKILYHISEEKFNEFRHTENHIGEHNPFVNDAIYLSSSRTMCLDFGVSVLLNLETPKEVNHYVAYSMDTGDKDKLYLYTCTFTKPLNIFNPSNKTDYEFIKRGGYARDDVLKKLAATHNWYEMEELIGEIPSIQEQYDGFVTAQYEYSNVGVFRPWENLKILKREGLKAADIVDGGTFKRETSETTFRTKVNLD